MRELIRGRKIVSPVLDTGPETTEYEKGLKTKPLEILIVLHLLLTLKLEITTSFLDINFKVKREIT